jgi:hypothetical protein
MVWSLVGNDGVIYRGAIRFDHSVEWALTVMAPPVRSSAELIRRAVVE